MTGAEGLDSRFGVRLIAFNIAPITAMIEWHVSLLK